MHRRPAGRIREEVAIDDTKEQSGEIVVGVELEEPESFLARLWHTEPALIRGFIAAAIALAVSFGVPITVEQKAQVLGFVAALLMLGQAWSTRQSVYSPATVDDIDDEADDAIAEAYHAGYVDAIEAESGVNRAAVG